MNKEDVNKYLTELIGECWHELTAVDPFPCYGCMHCGLGQDEAYNLDLFSPEGFYKLLQWAKEERWWIDFILTQAPGVFNFCEILAYETFPIKLYEFLRSR